MTLFDDSTARDLKPMIHETDTHNGGPAVIDAPEPAQPSLAVPAAETEAPAPEPAPAATDDFAAALENYTTETEDAVGDDLVRCCDLGGRHGRPCTCTLRINTTGSPVDCHRSKKA